MVLSHPPRFLSSQRCMKCSPVRGRHILLPETVSVGPPPLPPLMAVWLRVTRASPLWRGPLPCNCALTPPFPGLQALVGSYRQGLLGLWRSRIHLNAIVLLQVHQAKALRDLHEGGHDPQVFQEICTVTDLPQRRLRCSLLWWSRNAIRGCVWPT